MLENSPTFQASAVELIKDEQKLKVLRFLGEGVFSEVYELPINHVSIAVKTTDKIGFMAKELMELASTASESLGPLSSERPGRKIIQKMLLKDLSFINELR